MHVLGQYVCVVCLFGDWGKGGGGGTLAALFYLYCHCFFVFFSRNFRSHPLYRPYCSTTCPNDRRLKSRAPLVFWGWPLVSWTWQLVTLILLSIGPWLAAAQAPCAPGSVPSGPSGSCVSCVAGSFCPDGRTLLPCPPGEYPTLVSCYGRLTLPCLTLSLRFSSLRYACDEVYFIQFVSMLLFFLLVSEVYFFFTRQVFFAPPAWHFQPCALSHRIALPMRPARRCAPRPRPTPSWDPRLFRGARPFPSLLPWRGAMAARRLGRSTGKGL
jgi:hypothetical protein